MDAVAAAGSRDTTVPRSTRLAHPGGTRARASFRRSIRRCRHLLDVHRGAYGAKGVSVLALRDLPIDAVALAVSAYTTYVAEVLAEVVIARCEAALAGGDATEVLRAVLAEPGLAAELARSEVHRRDELRRVIHEHFRATVNVDGSGPIRAAIRRVGIWDDDASDLPSGDRAARSADELDLWIDTCAHVLHEPDPVSIRRDDADRCVTVIERAVDGIDAAAQRLIADRERAAGSAAG